MFGLFSESKWNFWGFWFHTVYNNIFDIIWSETIFASFWWVERYTTQAIDIAHNRIRDIQVGKCYLFDNTDDHIVTPINIATTNFKVTGYFNTASGAGNKYIIDSRNASDGFVVWVHDNDKLYFRLNSWSPDLPSVNTYTDWEWHYFEAEYDGATMSLLVDDETLSTAAVKTFTNPLDCYIWGSATTPWASPFNWMLYDIKVYEGWVLQWHYKMDEWGWVTAYDSSWNGNHGTITNATLSTFHTEDTGVVKSYQNDVWYSQVATFDGTNDYVLVATSPLTDIGSECFWIKFNTFTGDGDPMIYKSGTHYFSVDWANGQLQIYKAWWKNFALSSVTTGVWYHIAVTHTTGAVGLYIDNVFIETIAYTISSPAGQLDIWSRSDAVSLWVDWEIHDFRVYNTVLSSDNVAYIYTDWSSGTDPSANLSGHYELNEWSGTTINDSSWNGNHWVATNITEADFWGTLLPRDEANITKDVSGASLQYSWAVRLNMDFVESMCATFDWVDDYITTPVNISSNVREIKTRISTTSAGTEVILDGRTWGSTWRTIYHINWIISFKVNATLVSSVSSYNDGEWYEITISYDGTTMTLSVGEEVLTNSISLWSITSANMLIWVISYGTKNFYYLWKMCDVEVYEDGVIVWNYPLAEWWGTIAYDVSGNGNHGATTGITESTFRGSTQDVFHYNLTQWFTQVAEFDGVNDYIDTNYDIDSTDFKITCRFKLTSPSWDDILFDARYAGGDGFVMFFSNGIPKMYVENHIVVLTGNYNDGEWHDLTIEYDGATVTFTVDVETVTSSYAAGAFNTWQLRIWGRYSLNATTYYIGQLSDVKLYVASVLVLNYKLNEWSGTIIPDSSWNGNHWVATNITESSFRGLKIPSLTDFSDDAESLWLLNPAWNRHNWAETNLKAPLAPALLVADETDDFWFDASDVAQVIGYEDIVKNVFRKDGNNGVVAWGVTIANDAIVFDGATWYINLPNGDLDAVTDYDNWSLILDAVSKHSGVDLGVAVSLKVDANNNIEIYRSAANTWVAKYKAWWVDKSNTITLNDNTRGVIAITRDTVADEVKTYLNGVQVWSTLTGLWTWAWVPATSRLGLNNGTVYYFDGDIYSAKIYNTTLSEAEVLSEGGTTEPSTRDDCIGGWFWEYFDWPASAPTTIYDVLPNSITMADVSEANKKRGLVIYNPARTSLTTPTLAVVQQLLNH